MRIIVNWLFCLFIFLLLGSINSIPISENEFNNSFQNDYSEISNMKNRDIETNNEGISYNSEKNIGNNINLKNENVPKVKDDTFPTTSPSDSNIEVVDDENVSKSIKNQSLNNNSDINEFKQEKNKSSNGVESKVPVSTSFNNSDNGKFNNTVIYNDNDHVEEAKKEKLNNKESYEPCDCDEMDKLESNENDKGEVKAYNPSIRNSSNEITIKFDNVNNNNNKSSNNENNKNFDNVDNNKNANIDNNNSNNNKRGLMYASGVVMGALLFFVICGIFLKVKASQDEKRKLLSSNNRTLSLDLESIDSIDLRAGDLNSILSLETMEQYSDNQEVFVVDDGNNLKNIAKIYEIKGYKDHIFNTIDIGRNDSLNSLFDVSFNDNSSVRSFPYPYMNK